MLDVALAFSLAVPSPALRAPSPVHGRGQGEGAPVIVLAPQGQPIVEEELFARLKRADLVFVGEQHDQRAHHRLQADILKELRRLKPGMQVGIEMLDVTQQKELDAYLSGAMSEQDFAAFWKKAWGFDYSLYQPVLGYARAAGIRVHALNAPIAVIRQVVKGGLGSLSPEQRKLLPAEIHPIADTRYLAYVKQSLEGHGPVDPAKEARMLEAMAVWNETMGQSLVDALKDGPVLVVAGMGHMLFDAGILESVRNRSQAKQKVLLPYPMDGSKQPTEDLLKSLKDPQGDIQLADFFWLNP